jgi:hypothetical protein
MRRSSSGDQGSLRIVGSSWFLNRSLHCFPLRPLSCAATMAHFRSPCSLTSATISSSSSCDHGRLQVVPTTPQCHHCQTDIPAKALPPWGSSLVLHLALPCWSLTAGEHAPTSRRNGMKRTKGSTRRTRSSAPVRRGRRLRPRSFWVSGAHRPSAPLAAAGETDTRLYYFRCNATEVQNLEPAPSGFRLPTGEHLPAIPGRPGPPPRSPRRAATARPQALLRRHSKIAAVVRPGGVVAATSRTQHIWCLLFVLIRHGFRGGSGPQRLLI